MKLLNLMKSGLTESIDSDPTYSQALNGELSSVKDQVQRLVQMFSKFKLVNVETDTPSHNSGTRLSIEFTNKIVDLRLTITPKHFKSTPLYSCWVGAKVNPEFIISGGSWHDSDTARRLATSNSIFGLSDAIDSADFKELISNFQKCIDIVDEFTDWYFDISSDFGKIKLIRTDFDITTASSNTNRPRFVAIAGDFEFSYDIETSNKVNQRVFK